MSATEELTRIMPRVVTEFPTILIAAFAVKFLAKSRSVMAHPAQAIRVYERRYLDTREDCNPANP